MGSCHGTAPCVRSVSCLPQAIHPPHMHGTKKARSGLGCSLNSASHSSLMKWCFIYASPNTSCQKGSEGLSFDDTSGAGSKHARPERPGRLGSVHVCSYPLALGGRERGCRPFGNTGRPAMGGCRPFGDTGRPAMRGCWLYLCYS